jgi:microcystin-dependent protein
MPWSGPAGSKTYSRTDGTRAGTTIWQQAQAASVDIVSPDHDTHDQDMATALNQTLMKDGGNTATSNIPMGGFRHSNLGDALSLQQALTVKQAMNGAANYVPTVGGTANAITLTTGWTASTYAIGQTFIFFPTSTNSGATTINVDGIGVKNVYNGGSPLTGGEFISGKVASVTYDGTQFQADYTSPTILSVGMISAWPTATIPSGWLECDGSTISRSTYAALYAVITTTYGAGDGSTTFNLPNYKDYFLRGFDAAGTDAASRTDRGDGTTGANVGTKQAGATESHTHTGTTDNDGSHSHTATPSNGAGSDNIYVFGGSGGNVGIPDSGSGMRLSGITIPSGGAHQHAFETDPNAGTETRPKNITVKWCILAVPSAGLATGVPAAGNFSASPRLCHSGDRAPFASTDGTNATPVATEVYIAEVFVPANCTITGVANFNGSVASGNIKVGLASSAGAILATSASTAMAGTDAYQRVPFTATYAALGPATYYILLFVDNGTARVNTHPFGNFGAAKQTGQVYATGFTAITPPSTFTADLAPMASLY